MVKILRGSGRHANRFNCVSNYLKFPVVDISKHCENWLTYEVTGEHRMATSLSHSRGAHCKSRTATT